MSTRIFLHVHTSNVGMTLLCYFICSIVITSAGMAVASKLAKMYVESVILQPCKNKPWGRLRSTNSGEDVGSIPTPFILYYIDLYTKTKVALQVNSLSFSSKLQLECQILLIYRLGFGSPSRTGIWRILWIEVTG